MTDSQQGDQAVSDEPEETVEEMEQEIARLNARISDLRREKQEQYRKEIERIYHD